MGIERGGGYQLVLPLSLTGFLSGMITSGLVYPTGKLGGYFLGCVFGASLAAPLLAYGMLRGPWKAICLPVMAAAAYYFSIVVAAVVELNLPWQNWSMGQDSRNSPVALFAGGFAGGFLVLGGIAFLVYSKVGIRTLATKSLAWSVVGGVLGVIGWMLGPSLGMFIWSGVHALGLTAPTETFQNALYGETSHQYSLFVVWQTGMALVLAIMLHPLPFQRTTKSLTSTLPLW